jgi:hypothetical protein
MRAAIIGSSNLGLNGIAERNVIQIAELLSTQGYDVTIFTPSDYDKNNAYQEKFVVNRSIFRMDMFARKTFINLTNGRSVGLIGLFSFDLFYKELKDYDLYYFTSPNILFAKMSKYFYRNGKHPIVILGNQGTYFEYLNRKFMEKPIIYLLNSIIFHYLKRIDLKIQVQNSFQRDFYRKLGVPDRILLEMPMYNLDYTKYYIDSGKKYSIILNYGMPSLRWNRIIAETVKKLNDSTFILISYEKKTGKKLKKLSRFNNIRIFENPDDNLKYRLLASADVMINLSKYEPLNASYLEAPLSGLPLFTTNIYSAPELPASIYQDIKMVRKTNSVIMNNFIDGYKRMKDTNPISYAFLKAEIQRKSLNHFSIDMKNATLRLFEAPVSRQKISIVTASLNEASNIGLWLDQIFRIVELHSINSINEIVIVDDGSQDGTLEIIEEYRKSNTGISINLVKRNKKMGTLDAQIVGARVARNPYVIVMDCDLQHPVEYIEKFVEKFNYGYDIIIGSRYIVGGKNSWEPEREIISRVATMIAHIMFPFTYKIKDPLSGYFLCKRSILVNLKPYRYMYKLLLYVLVFNNINKNYIELPIEMRSRNGGESKVVSSYSRTVLMYSREILTYYRDYNKLKLKMN